MRQRLKTAVMSALPSIVVLGAFDLGCRWWCGESVWSLAYNAMGARAGQERVVLRAPLVQPDAVTGYRCIPGVHKAALAGNDVRNL